MIMTSLLSSGMYFLSFGGVYLLLWLAARIMERATMERWYIVFTLKRYEQETAFDGVFAASQDVAYARAMKRNPTTPLHVQRAMTNAEVALACRLNAEHDGVDEWWSRAEFCDFMRMPAYRPKQKN